MTKLSVEFEFSARLLRGVAIYEDLTIRTRELKFYAAYLFQLTSVVCFHSFKLGNLALFLTYRSARVIA